MLYITHGYFMIIYLFLSTNNLKRLRLNNICNVNII